MKICFATSECIPFMKAGGLADVSGALPKYISQAGHDVKIFVPLYGPVDRAAHGLVLDDSFSDLHVPIGERSEPFSVWSAQLPGSDVQIQFVHSSRYFDRPYLYSDDSDEDERFILFQRAVLTTLCESGWIPDVLHANDWSTALLPVLLKQSSNAVASEMASEMAALAQTASVLSIHNIGYQGTFDQATIGKAGLSYTLAHATQPFEYFGGFSFLKAGICFADVVATVSPTYAREIRTPEFGRGLEGVIRARGDRIRGILNGIDSSVWNPRNDSLIPFSFDAGTLEQKARNKVALLERFALPADDDVPLIGIISRLTEQKGFHLLEPILDPLLRDGRFRLVVLGSGDVHLQKMFKQAEHDFPDTVGTFFGYDEAFAHLIEAGSDMFLMPSIYEPCGLNQMYSLKYGTIPIVRNTGGLADTVRDIDDDPENGNGFVFDHANSGELKSAIQRAVNTFVDKTRWRAMQRRAMAEDFLWQASAKGYCSLYEAAVKAARSALA